MHNLDVAKTACSRQTLGIIILRQTIYILTLFFLTTSCGDRPPNIDDHSHALVDSINIAAKNTSTEKLPEDWSDFYYCDNLDSAIKYPDKVYHLQLRNYDIKRLPDDVTKFSKIEEMQLLWCYNFDWADVFNKLSKLQTLRILEIKDYNRNTLPKEVSKLKSLKEIIIQSDSSLSSIPFEISRLDSLQKLSISGNIGTFPKQVLQMKNLSILDLGSCKLKNVPKEISHLKTLTELNLSDNPIDDLPKEIGKLQNLEVLSVVYTNVKEFPETIINLRKLKTLYFDNTLAAERQYYVEELKEKMPNCKVMNYTEPPCGNTSR